MAVGIGVCIRINLLDVKVVAWFNQWSLGRLELSQRRYGRGVVWLFDQGCSAAEVASGHIATLLRW